jgi:hypothetical protein
MTTGTAIPTVRGPIVWGTMRLVAMHLGSGADLIVPRR